MPAYRLGVDIGGTFTDFSLIDEETGAVQPFKWPTVPADPARGVLDGLRELLRERGLSPRDLGYVAHGTTIAVNTVIERTGARLGLLVTDGFRDVLELRRLRLAAPVDFYARRPSPLVPRWAVREVRERLNAAGEVLVPLDSGQLLTQVRTLVDEHAVEGVVVAFLHAYRNPAHELAAAEAIARRWPELPVTCSHQVWPQLREYERTVATTINAYVNPKVTAYLRRLQRGLSEFGVPVALHVTKSNGGVTTAADAGGAAVQTMLSGPASGAVAAGILGAAAGHRTLVTLDVGGTSSDICVIDDGAPVSSRESNVGGFPLVLPAIEVTAIGAGGGSVARVDADGVLKVGPDSVGSDPGPACYGRGGVEPTLCDAFVVCGYLHPGSFAGRTISLEPELARKAIGALAGPLGLTVEEAAEAVVEVATATMFRGLRGVLARHGLDEDELCLMAYGGAGPVQAAILAAEAGISTVLIPRLPGVLCAMGAAVADARNDFVRSMHLRLGGAEIDLTEPWRELDERGRRWLARIGRDGADREFGYSADMRYVGQAFEINVPLPPAGEGGRGLTEALLSRFHTEHRRLYSHSDEQAPVEIVDLRLTVVARTPVPALAELPAGRPAAPVARRAVRFGRGSHQADVYERSALVRDQRVVGPAIVEQEDTTVVIPPGWTGRVDRIGNIVIAEEAA
jgi:N-methylhydantoinase A